MSAAMAIVKELTEKHERRIAELEATLGKVREYSAQLERDKTKLIRERDDLLAFIKGVGRQMSEVVKSFAGL